jgi:hypothetical protein
LPHLVSISTQNALHRQRFIPAKPQSYMAGMNSR